ncbi:Gfo/Idh/MocA family protein [Mycobacterium sp. NPDC048908]|uniref:Gfo/Idh/MocA family protein n=1 Tax=Mycobacterium sp. NPDC048908 TaxID=3364292 RepID=UPI00371520B8
MADRLKVGVVGAGVIAQVMHLNYLRELSNRFEVVALCDISDENVANNADRYDIGNRYTDWRDMLDDADIDAVLILTSGSHAPIAIAAANAGKHVLVEKPMCFSVAEGLEMKAAADAARVTLMVAYPKRYDPAFERFRDVAVNVAEPRLMRVTTFESPFLPYISHYPLAPVAPIPKDAIETFTAETQASITRAIGEATPFLREEYHLVLLDTLVHELNTVRGVLGEPTSLEYVDMQPGQLTVIMKFGELSVSIHWMDLPGITRYGMEFALYGPEQRVTLTFPSPFLRSAPATVEIVEGETGTTRSRSISEIISYESAFKLELEAFHQCVVSGTAPATSAEDAIHDLALCEAIIRFVQDRQPIRDPSAIAALAPTK